jgi:hypothetical protein
MHIDPEHIDFNKHSIKIDGTPDGKWQMQIGCPSFVFKFDTWEQLIVQGSSLFMNPLKWVMDNKVLEGNRKLNDVDINKIAKHLRENYKY